jgi:hypothetical protein
VGFLKDLKKLKDQGKEMSRDWDPGAQMQQARASMAAAGQAMEDQTTAARLAATGDAGSAQVTAARPTGQYVNLQPIFEMSLLVFVGTQPPYPVTVSQIVPMTAMGRLAPGSRLTVKVDPKHRETVWIDWAAS